MAQKYDLTDIGNALSRVMDNPMTKIIRSGSIGVLGVVNPVAGIVGGIGNDLLSEYNTFKLGHLLNGLASGFNLERRLNELYNYVNSSPEKAIIVANLFKQTVNAECPKVCVIYGLILANHLETLTEFTHEELIVCKALENATDYDLKNFKEIMENYLKPTSNGRRIVFPKENCFTNTVDCAISINHIVKNIINKKFPDVDFKCGIGVDYGELRVIKVGIQRRGEEHGENKGLVWVGYPANHASRLTDNANKEIRETVFKVKQYPIIPDFSFLFPAIPPFYTKMSEIGSSKPIIKYSTKEETTVLSAEEFAKKVYITRDGKFDIYGGRFVSFSKVENIYNYPGILMTEAVYKGYSEANPTSYDVIHNLWKEQNHNIKNISGKIYGSDIEWILK